MYVIYKLYWEVSHKQFLHWFSSGQNNGLKLGFNTGFHSHSIWTYGIWNLTEQFSLFASFLKRYPLLNEK
jgi:hypothetical protein